MYATTVPTPVAPEGMAPTDRFGRRQVSKSSNKKPSSKDQSDALVAAPSKTLDKLMTACGRAASNGTTGTTSKTLDKLMSPFCRSVSNGTTSKTKGSGCGPTPEESPPSTRCPSNASSITDFGSNGSARSHRSVQNAKNMLVGIFGERRGSKDSNESTFSNVRNQAPKNLTQGSTKSPGQTPQSSRPCSPPSPSLPPADPQPCRNSMKALPEAWSTEESVQPHLDTLIAAAQRDNYQLITTYNCSVLPSYSSYDKADPFWKFSNRSVRAVVVLVNLSDSDQVESAKKFLMALSQDLQSPLPVVVWVREPGVPVCESTDSVAKDKTLATVCRLIKAGAGDVILKCDQDTPMAIEVALHRTRLLWEEAEVIVKREQEEMQQEREKQRRGSRESSHQIDPYVWEHAAQHLHVEMPVVDHTLREELQPNGTIGIGDFHLVKELGRGAFGNVFEATTNGCPFAMKIINKRLCTSNRDALKVLREVKYLWKLPVHPNLPNLHTVLHSFEAFYLCMDYGGPEDLYKIQLRAPQKKLNPELAQDIFGQVVDALHHMHKHHVCHRDLKPENIAMQGSKACLVDLGLADDTRKVHDLCCGSLPFAAPEIMAIPCRYSGDQVDAWSLGVMLFEMIRGIDSFGNMLGWNGIKNPSPKLTEQLQVHMAHGVPSSQEPGQEHPDISDILSGLLTVNASARWTLQNVSESPWLACRVSAEQSLPKMC